MTTSSGACARSMSNLYWKPEQPPPSTLSRSMAPGGSPRRISPIRRAARSVTLRFSIPRVPSIQNDRARRSSERRTHYRRHQYRLSDSYVRRGHRSIGKSRRSSMAVEASHARALGLDEDLAEALALAHDLGHPPFGHAGERALDRCLQGCGGFDHNAQTLRVVTALERRYAAFDGLNLTWETLEGLVKHNGPL